VSNGFSRKGTFARKSLKFGLLAGVICSVFPCVSIELSSNLSLKTKSKIINIIAIPTSINSQNFLADLGVLE